MRVIVRTPNLELAPEKREEIERRTWMSLSRFANEIESVQVIATDCNGEKGGVDKRVVVTVNPRSLAVITAETLSTDITAAVTLGLARARRMIRKRLDRRRSRARRVLTT